MAWIRQGLVLRLGTDVFALMLLAVHGPSDCGGTAAVVSTIHDQLEIQTAPQRVRAQISAQREGEGLQADVTLHVDGREDRRVLHGESCEAIVEAAALVAVSLLESTPEPVLEPSPSPPTNEPEADVVVESEPQVEQPIDEQRDVVEEREEREVQVAFGPRTPARFGFGGSGGASLGAVPSISGVFGLHGAVAWRRALLSIGGSLQQSSVVSGAIPASIRLVAGHAVGCFVMDRRVGAGACAAADVGRMRGVLTGARQGARAAPWVALGAGVRGHWRPTPRWSVHLRAFVLAAAVRPRFDYGVSDGEQHVVHEPRLLSGRLMFGVTFFLQPLATR